MGALSKILKKAEAAEKKGRWDMVQYFLSQAMELARLNDDTEYLPPVQKNQRDSCAEQTKTQ